MPLRVGDPTKFLEDDFPGAEFENYMLLCPKCGTDLTNFTQIRYNEHLAAHGYDKPDNIDLQLLFVVMGEYGVTIKCEKGDSVNLTIGGEKYRLLFTIGSADTVFLRESFPEVRAAVDALDEKPPYPRIEQNDETVNEEYRYKALWRQDGDNDEHWTTISVGQLDALSQLAGKALPIWEPKNGEWERLPSTSEYLGDPLESVGIQVWRYTRRAK